MEQETMLVIDQMQREVTVPLKDLRIISLVPSQTELLYELGLDKEVIGITKFCVHPVTWFRTKTRVGGTKQLHLEQIRGMRPNLIIANKEENEREQVEALAEEFPVWISDIHNFTEAYAMIRDIGAITGRSNEARELIEAIKAGFQNMEKLSRPLSVAYFIWRNPWMVAGNDTFIHQVLTGAGFENAFNLSGRYPEVTAQQLQEIQPDLVFLSSEPYPFREKHIAEIQLILPGSKILLVDGEMFSWYGSRLKEVPGYLGGLINKIKS